MRKPDFFIVGAPRCGTTAMYEYLKAHPEIALPIYEKEPHFFCTDFKSRRFARFQGKEEKYLSLFKHGADRKCVGEASVFYLYSRMAATNIHAFNPEAKIIAMLRNPVEMIYSYFNLLLNNGDEDIRDFEEALAAEPDRKAGRRIPKTLYLMPEALYYREIIKFNDQLQRFFRVFHRENVNVIIFDDFKADIAAVYQNTLRFLEVDPSFRPEFTPVNMSTHWRSGRLRSLVRSKWLVSLGDHMRWLSLPIYSALFNWNLRPRTRVPLDPSIENRLKCEFRPEIDQLSKLLNRDLSFWYRD